MITPERTVIHRFVHGSNKQLQLTDLREGIHTFSPYLRQLLTTFYRRKIKTHLSMSGKSTFGSGSNAGASFSLSAQAIKFDKLLKLTEAGNFRT